MQDPVAKCFFSKRIGIVLSKIVVQQIFCTLLINNFDSYVSEIFMKCLVL